LQLEPQSLYSTPMSSCCKPSSSIPPWSTWVDRARPYTPLIAAAGLALVTAVLGAATGRLPFMDAFMGLFFIQVALLKLLDLNGFVGSFARYDLLAKLFPPYAHAYPFIEAGVGMLFLAGLWPVLTHIVTMIIMAVGVASALRVIARGQIVACACAGPAASIPVGAVTVFEYATMFLMAVLGMWGQ
jgi:hypothetical protein